MGPVDLVPDSEICFALQSCRLPALLNSRCSSSTRRGRVHHQALSFDCSGCLALNTNHQRCSLSSSPLVSLSSRHNSNCRSTLRSWISTALLVRTDKRQGTLVLLTKKNFLFRLFSFIVRALRGDCTVRWQSSDMFWEQRDCFVRKEGVCVCVCVCVLMLLQVIGRLSTERRDSEHRGQLSSLLVL